MTESRRAARRSSLPDPAERVSGRKKILAWIIVGLLVFSIFGALVTVIANQ